MAKINAVWFDPSPCLDDVTSHIKVVRFDRDDLQDVYKRLDVDLIDIAHRRFFGLDVNIICDDEGLLKYPYYASIIRIPTPSVFAPVETLVGKVLICGPDDGKGNLTDLPEYIINRLLDSCIYTLDMNAKIGLRRYVLVVPEGPAGGS